MMLRSCTAIYLPPLLLYRTSAPAPSAVFFFLNDPATPEISPLPLHDALPIWITDDASGAHAATMRNPGRHRATAGTPASRNIPSNSRFVYPRLSDTTASCRVTRLNAVVSLRDRKSTRLNSSHLVISYAVFCLK